MSAKKSRLRDPDRARHMAEAAKWIVGFTTGQTLQEFLRDKLLSSAVERQFEVLGKASAPISAATQAPWPSIDWITSKSFRNLLAHECFRTDSIQVWPIATALLPGLIPTLEAFFTDLDQQFGPNASV